MSNLFVPRSKESAVDTVVNSIKQLLLERRLLPGDKLPNELEISEGLQVSRGSVREAMKILSALGIVDIRVGNGTYICDSSNNNLLSSMLFSFFITNPNISELSEFRKIFEQDIVELIIEHYDENEEDRQALQNNLKELEKLRESKAAMREFVDNDIEFHRLLGRASHNSIARQIYDFVIDFLSSSIQATHDKNNEASYIVHSNILNAIESKDIGLLKKAISTGVDVWSNLQ